MVFNPTFNNISVISWRSVLYVEELMITTTTAPISKEEILLNKHSINKNKNGKS